jgi:transcriptional regulator with GAF, ATPase, and Fis domain
VDSSRPVSAQNTTRLLPATEAASQSALQRIHQVFNSTLDLTEVLQQIIAELVPLFAAQSASVILYHEQTQEAEIATSYHATTLHALRYPLAGSLAGWVATHKRPLRVTSFTPEEWPTSWQVAEQLGAPPAQVSVLLVPLWRQGAVIGSLEVVWEAGHMIMDHKGRITPEEFEQHVLQWLSRLLPASERGAG